MKRFYCWSALSCVFYLLCTSLLAAALYVIVLICLGEFWDNLLMLIVAVLSCISIIAVWILMIMTFLRKSIVFSSDSISVQTDLKGFFRMYGELDQYAVKVKYVDIVNIDCVRSGKSSRGRSTRMYFPTPYLYLYLRNGKRKAIHLYYFSTFQRKRIINELIRRVEKTGGCIPVCSAEALLKKIKFENDLMAKR